MSVIIAISDFIGKYAIATDQYNTATIQGVIDEVETDTLNNLLGTTLAAAFIADANANGGVPVDAENLVIYNAIQLNDCYEYNYSQGIKKMLIQLVYWTYQRQAQKHSTTAGLMKTKTANSALSTDNTDLTRIANKGITSYKTIQQYIYLNSSDYPTYEGINKHFKPLF